METVKIAANTNKKLNSAEQGKLWAAYMGNSTFSCILSHMVIHTDDKEIKDVLNDALSLSQQFIKQIKNILTQENYPIPYGLNTEDVNIGAPRLFTDDFYLHYLKYVAKSGVNLYGIAVPLMLRADTRAFFTQCLESTIKLINQINELLISKGYLYETASIPYPDHVEFIKKQSYLNGFFGKVRPLQVLEITHLCESLDNNAVSKAVLLGFSQIAQSEEIKAYFLKGIEMTAKHYDEFSQTLSDENLSHPPILDPMVTTSKVQVYSDRLMMAHKVDMFSMRIRTYGNALAFSARHDISVKYGRLLLEVGNYLEDGANILIEHGWIEQLPQAPDREALVKD